MKRLSALIFSMICLGCSTMMAQASIKFDKTSHNFGTFPESSPVTHTFKFTNTGNEPLIIRQVFTSCGCTVAEYTEKPVSPGKTGIVKVTYNGKNRYPRKFTKQITVDSNAKEGVVRLHIEGKAAADE